MVHIYLVGRRSTEGELGSHCSHTKFWSQKSLTSQFHNSWASPGHDVIDRIRIRRSVELAESRRVVARAAAVGNAVAARQVIVIGAAVPLSRPSLSTRTLHAVHAVHAVRAWLCACTPHTGAPRCAQRSFFSR